MVGCESDRPRNPKAGLARSRRAEPIAPASINPVGCGDAQLGRSAGFRASGSTNFRTAQPATDSAEAQKHRAACACRSRLRGARDQPTTGATAAANRGSSRSRWRRPSAKTETAAGVDAASTVATAISRAGSRALGCAFQAIAFVPLTRKAGHGIVPFPTVSAFAVSLAIICSMRRWTSSLWRSYT